MRSPTLFQASGEVFLFGVENDDTMTNRSLLQIPPGAQCFYDRDARLRRAIERKVAGVFTGWSYEELLLPLFDYLDVFERAGGEAFAHRIYRFIGRDGEVLALRPDFTALVAKVVASRLSERTGTLRLFYSGEVLRYEPPRAGRREELFQIGLEHIAGGIDADLEVLVLVFESLEALGIENAMVTVGHAGFIGGLLAEAEVVEPARSACLDALRRRDIDRLVKLLASDAARRFVEASGLSGGVEVLGKAARLSRRAEALEAVERLAAIARELGSLGFSERVQFDLGEVRDLAYYTGMIFEIHAPGAGLELGGGGRYDGLLTKFGCDRPAVGFSLSLDRLAGLVSQVNPWVAAEEIPETVDQTLPLAERLKSALELSRRGFRVKLG